MCIIIVNKAMNFKQGEQGYMGILREEIGRKLCNIISKIKEKCFRNKRNNF